MRILSNGLGGHEKKTRPHSSVFFSGRFKDAIFGGKSASNSAPKSMAKSGSNSVQNFASLMPLSHDIPYFEPHLASKSAPKYWFASIRWEKNSTPPPGSISLPASSTKSGFNFCKVCAKPGPNPGARFHQSLNIQKSGLNLAHSALEVVF